MRSGQQIILDLYNCNFDRLNAADELESALREVMREQALPVVAYFVWPRAGGTGFSLVLFHEYGHIIIHTFPDLGYALADALSTLDGASLNKITAKIKHILQAEKTKNTVLKRGDFGSVSDMKPTVKKQTKALRRVRNTRDKVLSMFKRKKPTID